MFPIPRPVPHDLPTHPLLAGTWGVPTGDGPDADDADAFEARQARELDAAVAQFAPLVADSAAAYRAGVAQLLAAIDAVTETDGWVGSWTGWAGGMGGGFGGPRW